MREPAAAPNVYRVRKFFHEEAIDALEGPGCCSCRGADPVGWGGDCRAANGRFTTYKA
jgi:hypothetical protein